MANEKLAKAILLGVAGIVTLLGVWYAILRSVGIIDQDACISDQVKIVPNFSGAKVEIVYTNCDTLTKNEAISVYFSRPTKPGESWFAQRLNHRTLIFRYDPGRPDNALPSMTHPSGSTILIAVPEVSSVIYQNRTWRDMSIEYAIGKVYYPTKRE